MVKLTKKYVQYLRDGDNSFTLRITGHALVFDDLKIGQPSTLSWKVRPTALDVKYPDFVSSLYR